jgi:hypothetical protein
MLRIISKNRFTLFKSFRIYYQQIIAIKLETLAKKDSYTTK